MRELGPDHILQLIRLRGMITRVGEIIPDMKQALSEAMQEAY